MQHYGPDSYNKNFIYRGDDWLFCQRWELLFEQRASVDLAQVITWNDYGESHYVGPVEGAQPNSQAWTDGFAHDGSTVFDLRPMFLSYLVTYRLAGSHAILYHGIQDRDISHHR